MKWDRNISPEAQSGGMSVRAAHIPDGQEIRACAVEAGDGVKLLVTLTVQDSRRSLGRWVALHFRVALGFLGMGEVL